MPDPVGGGPMTVQFAKSGVTLEWDGKYESILEMADDHAIEISSGCKYGDCGTCMTALLEGSVAYNHRTGIDPDNGFCLPCSCQPATSIVLDL